MQKHTVEIELPMKIDLDLLYRKEKNPLRYLLKIELYEAYNEIRFCSDQAIDRHSVLKFFPFLINNY